MEWLSENWIDCALLVVAGAAAFVAVQARNAARAQATGTADAAVAAKRSADASEAAVDQARRASDQARRSADEAERAGHAARKPVITVRTETGEWGYPFVVHLTTTCDLYRLKIRIQRGSDSAQAAWWGGIVNYGSSRVHPVDQWTAYANVDAPGKDHRGLITAGSTFSLRVLPSIGGGEQPNEGRAVFVCRCETEDGEVWDDVQVDTGVVPIVWRFH